MGDPLTLETAEERALWLATYGVAWGFHASDSDDTPPEDAADAAVRAYRERCAPEPRGAPRDYTVPREQLGRLLAVILGGDQVAYCMDPVATVAEVDAAIELACPRRSASECSCLDTGAYHEDPPPCPVHGGLAGPRLLEVVPGVIRDLHRLAPGLGSVLQAALTADRRGPRVDVEALRSLLADLADGVRPIDREEVSRRIGEALGDTPSDPAPEPAPTVKRNADDGHAWTDCDACDGYGCDVCEPSGAPTGPGWPMTPTSKADIERWGEYWWHRSEPVRVSVRVCGDHEGKLFYKYGLVEGDAWGGPCIQGSALDTLREGFESAVSRANSATYRLDALIGAVESALDGARSTPVADIREALAVAKAQAATGKSP